MTPVAVHFASLRGAAIVRGDGELEKSLISYLTNLTTSPMTGGKPGVGDK